jgi:hypothetical protein
MAGRREHPDIPADPDRFHEAVKAFRKRVPVTNDEWDDLTDEERDFAVKVGVTTQADLVQDVYDALDRAIDQGTTFEDFQDDVAEQLYDDWGGDDPAQLETIFRTNVMTAYNEGREEIFNDPAVRDSHPYWRWELIDDGSQSKDDPCLECEDVVLPADDPWWDEHPRPLHPNCRCTFTAITAEEAGEDETESPPAAPGGFDSDDWEPDVDGYDAAIRDEIRARLG